VLTALRFHTDTGTLQKEVIMSSPPFIAIIGSMGSVTLIFSIVVFLLPFKTKPLAAESSLYIPLFGIALFPLFLPQIHVMNLLISLGIFCIFLLIFIPFRGLSFQTDVSMEELEKKIPELLQCSKPEQSSLEPRSIIFHTDNGLIIIAKPAFGNKFQHVFVTGGFKIKNILATYKLLAPFRTANDTKKETFVLFIFSVLLIILFLVFRSRITGV